MVVWQGVIGERGVGWVGVERAWSRMLPLPFRHNVTLRSCIPFSTVLSPNGDGRLTTSCIATLWLFHAV